MDLGKMLAEAIEDAEPYPAVRIPGQLVIASLSLDRAAESFLAKVREAKSKVERLRLDEEHRMMLSDQIG